MTADANPPPDIDTAVSNPARIWNYLLGGKDNYAIDREVGDQIMGVMPQLPALARGCRDFMSRAVRLLAGKVRLRQFLQVGSGLPTDENTHEVATAASPPGAAPLRVVYVDNDPLVLSHSRALLASSPACVTDHVDADLRDPDAILRAAADTLDLSQPVVLTLMGALMLITDDEEAYAVVDRLLDALPSGSYLALYGCAAESEGDEIQRCHDMWNAKGSNPAALRTPEGIARFFSGVELMEPGLVSVTRWRPEGVAPGAPLPPEVSALGGVGRKP